ncbi:hypothetical protein K457DRAFT_540323 [Linnemannia elongata AG-77]|uniref:Uncharacterized protein n=1 Tax=Linnemannia elongata AG-77 TaxID=1314771 RepID=A0A197JUK7_9FUNG|nr:hypothetical protein K457DRAFT_540323 [Linnemannia elongata AG-77]
MLVLSCPVFMSRCFLPLPPLSLSPPFSPFEKESNNILTPYFYSCCYDLAAPGFWFLFCLLLHFLQAVSLLSFFFWVLLFLVFFDYGHSLNRTPLNPVFLQIVSKETRERKEEKVSRQRN